jgi:ceramide glucosyltransferase
MRALGRYVAEDYMAGRAVQSLGLRVEIVPDAVVQHIGAYGFHDFWSRHLRWGRIRKAQAPLAFLGEPLFGAILSGVVGAGALEAALGVPWALVLAAHLFIWWLADLRLLGTLALRPSLDTFGGWLARELLALPLWCHIAVGNRILWRGNRLRILPGGVLA